MDKTSKKKTNADDMFLSDIKVADFAAGLARLPQLGDMLRLSGVQDGRTMAGVKMTSARINAIRAEAIGDARALKRARRAEGHATTLAAALQREETRVRPEASMLGDLVGLAGKFRLYGKVVDEKGQPVPGAQVEVAGKDTGVLFTARTNKDGIYDLAMAVGGKDDEADDGEGLMAAIKKDGQILQAAVKGLIKEGGTLHRIMTVPLLKQVTDLAAPIAETRPTAEADVKPSKSPVLTDLQGPPIKGQTDYPKTPDKAEVTVTPVKPQAPKKPAAQKPTARKQAAKAEAPAVKPARGTKAKRAATRATPAKARTGAKTRKPTK